MDDSSEHKKAKGTKKCVIKRGLMVKNYKDCLLNDETILKSQQRFKSDYLSSDNDKRLQTFDKITTHPYRTNVDDDGEKYYA